MYVNCFVGFQVYPPPTTPPEPAPPDNALNQRHSSRGPILSASQTSLDEITCKTIFCVLMKNHLLYKLFFINNAADISGSRESLATHDSGEFVLFSGTCATSSFSGPLHLCSFLVVDCAVLFFY